MDVRWRITSPGKARYGKGDKSPYDGDWTYWTSRIGKHLGVRKEVITLLKQ